MASDIPTALAEAFVLARQALWAGDREGALYFLDTARDLLPAMASHRIQQFASLEDIVAENVSSMLRELERLESRGAAEGDLAAGALDENPYIESHSLRGVVFGEGFGQFYLRAYLMYPDLEQQFRQAVHEAAITGINFLNNAKEEGPVDDNAVALVDDSRRWFDIMSFPKVLVQVGEFTLVEGQCSWCPPPDDANAVRERFLDVLKTIDPLSDE